MSPCTDGSLGFDAQFLGSSSLKLNENHSYDSLHEETALEEHETSAAFGDEGKEVEHETAIAEVEEEQETREEDVEIVELQESKEEECELSTAVEETKDEEDVAAHEHVHEQENSEVEGHAAEEDQSEVSASGIPNRAVKTGTPTPVQSRGLSAASLALKKKQAAENAAAAIKAVAVEIPETDSIANRIKIFGGANPTRSIGLKKLGVRDMVQKFKNVEEQSQEQIAHVVRGHNDSEPRGVCSAYSLSTASRPLRSTPRRKISHELSENETREVISKFGGMARNDDDRMGVIQESVHSVKNAKSIFENLARAESGAQR
ncbi:hypothetical protein BGX26_006562 [Mortierella sp. AD094]|nr:hypothetical protein BGX26_006562 [Mortierella sp. AD094]